VYRLFQAASLILGEKVPLIKLQICDQKRVDSKLNEDNGEKSSKEMRAKRTRNL
jgi:hypothetical protein